MKLTPARTGLFLAISALLAPNIALAQTASNAPQSQSAHASSAATGATAAAAAPMQATELDAVQVQGTYIPEPMLLSSAVMTHVSKEDLERQGDSTAADALQRVAGISINHVRYVSVRGLKEPYASALLHHTTEERRVGKECGRTCR